MRRFLLPLLLVLGAFGASAQTYFNRQHPLEPTGFVAATAIMPTDTGYVVVGVGTVGPPYSYHMLVASFDLQGQPRHHRLFAPPVGIGVTPSQAGPLERLPDGGFASAGAVSYGGGPPPDGQLWRFTATGDTLWTRTYHQPGNLGVVFNNQVYLPVDSGFALVGNQRQSATQGDLILLRTDKNGRERWRHTYRQPGQRFHSSGRVLPTPDGGFLVAGYSAPDSGNGFFFNGDWLVIKTDAAGQEQWRYTLATPYHESCDLAVNLPGGGYLLGGFIGRRFDAQNQTVPQILLVRLDAQGQEQWRRPYGPARYGASSISLHLQPDGSAVLSGQTPAPPQQPTFHEQMGFALNVCAATGDSIWHRTYRYFNGPNTRHYLRDFTPTPDGGFVGTGFIHARPPDVSPQSIWLFKTDQHGYVQAGGTPPPAVACALLAVEAEAPERAATRQFYPNPSAGVVRLSGPALPPGRGYCLRAYDAQGRLALVQALTAEALAEGVTLRLRAGIYQCLLEADGKVVARERLLVTR